MPWNKESLLRVAVVLKSLESTAVSFYLFSVLLREEPPFVFCFSDMPNKPACTPRTRKESANMCACVSVSVSSHTVSVCPQQGEPPALFQSGLIRSDVRL